MTRKANINVRTKQNLHDSGGGGFRHGNVFAFIRNTSILNPDFTETTKGIANNQWKKKHFGVNTPQRKLALSEFWQETATA